jgi:site-specific DNA recombinase
MTSPTGLRTALYARVSSEQQVADDTIASQLDLLERRFLRDGVSVPPELRFLDDGFRGETLQRPGLERLRDVAAAGGIDRLYVECPDRLARDYPYQMVLVDELRHHGIEIIFLNRNLDESPEGRLLLQVQGIIAEFERTKIRERCRRGRLFAARAGRVSVLAGAPYGYRYLTKQEGGGTAQYQVVLAEAQVVREMFAWVGIEGCSLGQVCRRLQKRGVLTQTGKTTWDRTTVRDQLRNPASMGDAHFHKEQTVPARPRLRPRRGVAEFPRRPRGRQPTPAAEQIPIPVPAIVEPALFQAVQERLAEHRSHPGRAASQPRYLLAGLVVCKRCGYAYRGRMQNGKAHPGGYRYYRCYGTEAERLPGGVRVCAGPSIQVERLDEAVWSDVRALLLEPERLTGEFERRLRREEAAGGTTPTGRSLDKLIGQVRRRMARLVEMYAEGFIEKDQFQRDMDISRCRLSELESQRQALREEEQQREELRLVISRLEEFGQQVRAGLDTSDLGVRRRIICALVKQVEIDAEEVHIVYRVSPLPFARTVPAGGNMPLCWDRVAAPSGQGSAAPRPESGGLRREVPFFRQRLPPAQQGGAGGDVAGGGLDSVAGTAAAPAFSIDQGAIQGCTAAGDASGAVSPHQLATVAALVDHQEPVASGAIRDRADAETSGRRARCWVTLPGKLVPSGGRDRYIWSEPIARTRSRAPGRRGSRGPQGSGDVGPRGRPAARPGGSAGDFDPRANGRGRRTLAARGGGRRRELAGPGGADPRSAAPGGRLPP